MAQEGAETRKIAQSLYETAKLSVETDTPEEAAIHYQKAESILLGIPDNEFTLADQRLLSHIQLCIACRQPGEVGQKYYLQAIQNYESYQNQFTPVDWYELSLCYNGYGCRLPPASQQHWYEKAITAIKQIPSAEFTSEHWHALSYYQNNMSLVCSDEAVFSYLEEAIHSQMKIPVEYFSKEDFYLLAEQHTYLGFVYEKKKEVVKAHKAYNTALDICAHARINDFELILAIYDKFTAYFSRGAGIFDCIYTLGRHCFSQDVFEEDLEEFTGLFIEVTTYKIVSLYYPVMQLFRLIAATVQLPGFPNKDIKDWLANQKTYAHFKEMIKTLQELHQPQSLFQLADESVSVSLSLIHQQSTQNERIKALEKEQAELRAEIVQLKTLYASKQALFSQQAAPKSDEKFRPPLQMERRI